MTVKMEVIAAFKNTAENLEEGYVVEAGIKEVLHKGKEAIKKGGKALRNKVLNFHHKSMEHHKAQIDKINSDPSRAVPGDHTYHKTMHGWHKGRYENMVQRKHDPIHSTVNPKEIKSKKDAVGNKKPKASRAEQAAFQHHRERSNDLAMRHNKRVIKGKGDHPETKNIKDLHHEHEEAAKSIKNKRSLPKAKKVDVKSTPEEAKAEVKRHGNFGKKRSDETKKKISDAAKARHAARKEAKAKEERKATRAAKKTDKKVEKPAAEKPAKKTAKKVEKPAVEKKVAPKKTNTKAAEKFAAKKKVAVKKPRLEKK